MRRNSRRTINFILVRLLISRRQWRSVVRFLAAERGLTATEYAVAAGLIAASMLVAFGNLGLAVDSIILAVIAFM
jgi:Flp pilus assembly pilin Flp